MSPGQGRKLLPTSRDELGEAGEGCAGIPLMCVSLAGMGGRCLCWWWVQADPSGAQLWTILILPTKRFLEAKYEFSGS